MNGDIQSVQQTVSSMESVLKSYLSQEDIAELSASWQTAHASVSVKMIQQCVMELIAQHPRLRSHKSDIRKAFWSAALETEMLSDSSSNTLTGENTQAIHSDMVNAFYSVMLSIKQQLSAASSQQLFTMLHQTIAKERTFKGHPVEIMAFLEGECPPVPDDVSLLNTLVQLAYVCLCDVEGPVAADDMFYQAAEAAKAKHPNAVVEQLF